MHRCQDPIEIGMMMKLPPLSLSASRFRFRFRLCLYSSLHMILTVKIPRCMYS